MGGGGGDGRVESREALRRPGYRRRVAGRHQGHAPRPTPLLPPRYVITTRPVGSEEVLVVAYRRRYLIQSETRWSRK
ncbi:hypothetical protein O3P69_006401 [Scylla paramamosain]|uniref:Uncharacterized protein n=1 Tax=Scylla paramamosain TaxID=85552 RepID=A0AAW0U3Q3_SCYPA